MTVAHEQRVEHGAQRRAGSGHVVDQHHGGVEPQRAVDHEVHAIEHVHAERQHDEPAHAAKNVAMGDLMQTKLKAGLKKYSPRLRRHTTHVEKKK